MLRVTVRILLLLALLALGRFVFDGLVDRGESNKVLIVVLPPVDEADAKPATDDHRRGQ